MSRRQFRITIDSIIILIGVSCIGGGGGTIIGYVYGDYNLSRWYGDVPMALATSIFVFLIGIALYLIGKFRLHDESNR